MLKVHTGHSCHLDPFHLPPGLHSARALDSCPETAIFPFRYGKLLTLVRADIQFLARAGSEKSEG
jgi:hypothetical protein